MVTNNSANLKGTVIQEVRSNYATQTTTVTAIPYDNTIPQNTEGAQLTTVTITPKSSTNVLVIRWIVQGFCDNNKSVSAIFQDSTANALAAAACTINATDFMNTMSGAYTMAAGTTSATTFKLRAGPSAGTLYLNQTGTGARLGGVCMSYLSVTEYQA